MGKGYYEEYRQDQSLSEYGLTPFNIGSQNISSTDLIRRKWLDNDFYGLIFSAKYKKDRTEIIAGGGLNQYLGDHFGNIIWMKTAGNTEKDHRWYLNNSIKNEFSIYGKINYMLSENLTAFGDLQYRHISYRMNGPDDDLKDLNQNHFFDFFNPKAGLFYTITPNQDAYLSFSVANREPSRSDFKEASGDLNATPKPETLFDTELGYKLRGEKGSFAANLYGMFYKDQLIPTGELSDVGYPVMTNVEKSYRTGIELSAAVKLSEHISWNINYTLSRNKIANFIEYYTDYDTVMFYRNRNLGLVNIAYSPGEIMTSDMTFKFNKVSLHLISKYVGKQYFDNTMNNERSINPYFVNNIRIDVTPKIKNLKGLDIQLNINNFLNETYESNAYGGTWSEFGSEKSWSYYFPQAGINYLFRVSLKF
jgi:iron complex outermembrane receptor protein